LSHQGKVCIITGATDGIGKEAALNLAKMGFALGLVGRNTEKISEAKNEIINATNNQNVTFFKANLSSMDQVRQLAKEIQTQFDHIDILLNNAGAYFSDFGKTEEGLENTFALNHLSYFLFTDLLLDTIKATPKSRIVNVASDAHLNTNMSFDNLQGQNGYKGWPAYCKSKLCNVMFTYELARRLEGSDTTANCLHPGFVNTNFVSELRHLLIYNNIEIGSEVILSLNEEKTKEHNKKAENYLFEGKQDNKGIYLNVKILKI